jgi:hypothetical protein
LAGNTDDQGTNLIVGFLRLGGPAAALVHNVHGVAVTFTFGLLSPDKGIEHVIDALPVILARYPDTIERADKNDQLKRQAK